MAIDHLSIDIETYSSVDIKKSGLYKYVQSPDFEILLFAFSFNGEPVRIVDLTQEKLPPRIISALVDPNVIKHAYNAAFEWYCLSKYLGKRDYIAWLSQWRCTQLHGLYLGYPAGLAAIGEALGLPSDKKKMSVGTALINYFCKPCSPTRANGMRTRNLPQHSHERWELFKQYCCRDVETEMTVDRRLSGFPVPDDIQRQWELDQRINAYGVRLDTELMNGAIECSEQITATLMEEAAQLTGINNPKSITQLKEWLEDETDDEVPSLNKQTVSDLIKKLPVSKARRVLEIRQELGKTSVSKYKAMSSAICADGRARGLIQFYGACRTGRWAGRLVQVHNLPRPVFEHINLDLARELVQKRDSFMIKYLYGSVPDLLSTLIRTTFIPSAGNKFVVADFSAIEARVISWLAGESWRQEVFATHGKIYEASASQMFHVPIERIKKGNPEYALRAKGKVAELALGYQGGVPALKKIGADKMGLSDEELSDIVFRWRQANPRIKDLWYKINGAALTAVQDCVPVGVQGLILARECDVGNGLDFLTAQLPSGRKLFYPQPSIVTNRFGEPSVAFKRQKGKAWCDEETYGGKLTENIVQAIARDCLAVTLERIENAGFQTVMHIHDEAVVDCPAERADLEVLCALMKQPIPWAAGLVLNADGFVGDYYKKE